jgi:hypothetical protein
LGPDSLLKWSPFDIKGQVELGSLSLKVFRELLNSLMIGRRIGKAATGDTVAKVN